MMKKTINPFTGEPYEELRSPTPTETTDKRLDRRRTSRPIADSPPRTETTVLGYSDDRKKFDKRRKPIEDMDSPTMTEAIVLGYLAQGKSNADIAKELSVSRRTIESHVSSLLNKTNCKSRFELIIYLIGKGTLPPIGVTDRLHHLEKRLIVMEQERNDAIEQLKAIRTIFNRSIVKISSLLNTEDFT
jgi:DNA-binding CsgD family transcriptional regulator